MLDLRFTKHLSLKDELHLGKIDRTYHVADGIPNSNRVDGTTQRKLYTKVVDNVLNSATLYSRWVSSGTPFDGKTVDVTYDVTEDTTGQFFTGLETLNSSATNTTATGSYAHTAFTQPVVSIMLESFANVGSLGVINLDTFKYEKAGAQAMSALGSAIYGTGTANRPLGLGAIVNDGDQVATIGGLSRTTYTTLVSQETAYTGGALTLLQMGQQYDDAIASGMDSEEPNVAFTTKDIFSLYEQLLAPNVRASYESVGYDRVGVRSRYKEKNNAQLRDAAGFRALSYRGIPFIRDDFATSGNLWFLNENYVGWQGRTEVPKEYKDVLEKVNFGTVEDYEGTGAELLDMPSEFNGWFYQNPLTIPQQAGRLARFYVIGQNIPRSFRRQSYGTGITTV
jgi:hypothetical protein